MNKTDLQFKFLNAEIAELYNLLIAKKLITPLEMQAAIARGRESTIRKLEK